MGIQVSEAAPEKQFGSPSKEAGIVMDLDSTKSRRKIMGKHGKL